MKINEPQQILVSTKMLDHIIPDQFKGELDGGEYTRVVYSNGLLQIGLCEAFECHSQKKYDWAVTVNASSVRNLKKLFSLYQDQPISVGFKFTTIDILIRI